MNFRRGERMAQRLVESMNFQVLKIRAKCLIGLRKDTQREDKFYSNEINFECKEYQMKGTFIAARQ